MVLDDTFATDPHQAEPEELRSLQAGYRQRLLLTDPNLFHPLNSSAELKAYILMMEDELARLRRNSLLWAAAMTALLVAILALVVRVLFAVTEPGDQARALTVLLSASAQASGTCQAARRASW